MALRLTTSYLEDSTALFAHYKKLAEKAMEQLEEEQLFYKPDSESNCIALIVKHMAGNMRSRWTDLLTSDGEKPSRNRDSEFEDPHKSREDLVRDWESGWACLFQALEGLEESDLQRTVTIRGEAHSVMQAINRQIAHYSYHVGQIVFLSKHLASGHWSTLSVGRNKSSEFNAKVQAGELSQR